MFSARVKTIGIFLSTMALLAGGPGLCAARVPVDWAKHRAVPSKRMTVQANQNTGVSTSARPADESAQKINALLKQKLDTASLEFEARMNEFLVGKGWLDFLCAASRRVLDAQRDLAEKKADHIAALEAHWQRMKQIEEKQVERFNAARIPIQDVAQAKYHRLEAEVWLEKAKALPKPKK